MVIFINQIRMKIGVMFGSPETTTGGNALKFYASVRLDIRRIGAIKERDEVVGNQTRVKVVKNKVAPPFKQVEFDIMYGEGISKTGELIDLGVKAGIVEKSGAWFSYDSQRLGQGRENAKKFLKENPDVAAAHRGGDPPERRPHRRHAFCRRGHDRPRTPDEDGVRRFDEVVRGKKPTAPAGDPSQCVCDGLRPPRDADAGWPKCCARRSGTRCRLGPCAALGRGLAPRPCRAMIVPAAQTARARRRSDAETRRPRQIAPGPADLANGGAPAPYP